MLPAENFPAIVNEELLINRRSMAVDSNEAVRNEASLGGELAPEEAISQIYREQLKHDLLWSESVEALDPLSASAILLDMRGAHEYASHRLAGSLSLPGTQPVLELFSKFPQKFEGKKIFLICEVGLRSMRVAQALRRAGIDIVSIAGGMARWSEKGLPRIRAVACMNNFPAAGAQR